MDASDEVLALLVEVDLRQFHQKIRDELQVTRVGHFKHVRPRDLTRVGLSDPAARRLMEAARGYISDISPTSHSSFFGSLKQKMRFSNYRSSSLSPPAKISQVRDSPIQQSPLFRVESNAACLINTEELSLRETIGSGNFGVVRKALWRHGSSCDYVAVKVLRNEFADRQLITDMISEVAVMQKLDHPNLVKLHGVCFGSANMLVTELAPLGSLLDYLRRNTLGVEITQIVSYARQLALALEYLESKKYIHRDIALRNVLLASEDLVKLGDFGLARIIPREDEHYVSNSSRKIPFAWSAPESLRFLEFTHSSDTWMYGVAVWEMFTFGEEPWQDLRAGEILEELSQRKRLQKPVCCPSSIYRMLLQCWRSDPNNRPTFSSIVKYISSGYFLQMNASVRFDDFGDASKLKFEKGDCIYVISGYRDNRLWFGQNKRTLDFGYFLRSNCELTKSDISRPVPGSLACGAGQNLSHHLRSSLVDLSKAGHNDDDPQSFCFSANSEISQHIPSTGLETRCKKGENHGSPDAMRLARAPLIDRRRESPLGNKYGDDNRMAGFSCSPKPVTAEICSGRQMFDRIPSQLMEQTVESSHPEESPSKTTPGNSVKSPAKMLKELNAAIQKWLACTQSHYLDQAQPEASPSKMKQEKESEMTLSETYISPRLTDLYTGRARSTSQIYDEAPPSPSNRSAEILPPVPPSSDASVPSTISTEFMTQITTSRISHRFSLIA